VRVESKGHEVKISSVEITGGVSPLRRANRVGRSRRPMVTHAHASQDAGAVRLERLDHKNSVCINTSQDLSVNQSSILLQNLATGRRERYKGRGGGCAALSRSQAHPSLRAHKHAHAQTQGSKGRVSVRGGHRSDTSCTEAVWVDGTLNPHSGRVPIHVKSSQFCRPSTIDFRHLNEARWCRDFN